MSICPGHLLRILNLRRHHRHLKDVNLLRHRRHPKDGNLPMKGWMGFFESFVRAALRGSGSFAGYSDFEPRALSYLPATRFCFVFVASCYLAAAADKHFPVGRNTRKVVAILRKD